MRIGVDARELVGYATGVGRYLGGLLREWTRPGAAHGHEIVLYMEGFRTTRDRVYLSAGQELKIRHMLERLPAGEMSEQPVHAPPVPPPPDGTYMPPRTPRP